ncbi:hypothetical protein GOFOIKOB_6353 [Methylobacterium tardum]|uniref:Glycosyltransferase n=1 Tax=Methylobacterium tardum TaxID=374432 RepID=A0AA37T777_9HYPH|nr:glycosyltransferase [Methylobacterium tardum]URD37947.1 glycosyltransferase [Methylobacterium tardum]GJE53275.1 hypothetical protein GOFOIKOB_6353 [Methylobacterium tardum]GLS68001.1 hypothetical protein GCM10007890_00120 [Methylobacterium tardum]
MSTEPGALTAGKVTTNNAATSEARFTGQNHRVVLVCSAYTDGRSGQTIVLDALTRSGADVVLVSLRAGPGLDQVRGHFAEVIVLPEENIWYAERGPTSATDNSLYGRATILNRCAGLLLSIEDWTVRLAERLANLGATVVVGCSGAIADLSVGAKVAAALGVPFVAYLFDDPVYQWTDERLERPAALLQERVWAPAAATILVANEEMTREMRVRNPDLVAPFAVIRNPAPAVREPDVSPRPPRSADEAWTIAYTGSVYHAQADAFRNLLAGFDWIDESWELHVASHQSEEALQLNGLAGPKLRLHGALSPTETLDLQAEADVLFLPLAFEAIPNVIRTSAPLKTGEYLASGRPILVHAPEDSWLARFFRERGCGLVVDQPSVPLLAAALLKLRRDETLRADLVRRQYAAAGEFALVSARQSFWSALDAAVNGGRS